LRAEEGTDLYDWDNSRRPRSKYMRGKYAKVYPFTLLSNIKFLKIKLKIKQKEN
jgi:hypothetical protein